ncbi:TetR family transcriptional regulator C-terminal domain-containing protein [Psychromonas sp. KJ10-10]|uniref:TetR family transcriptional regulator C-terminal domain-containing protein n=1 Tax=Psychromonas sp. KJ10-10 TaxID=3391823 RepID=UPI0039B3DA1B
MQRGLPKANLLYYFSNKANLYNTVLEGIVHQWDRFFTDITEDDDPAESLESYIRIKVEHALNYPNASKIFATEIIQGAPNMNDKLRQYVHDNLTNKCKVIESWIAQGKMNKVDPHHLFFLIWSSTQYYADYETQVLLITDKQSYHTEDIERISRFLCHMILSGCGLKPTYQL